MSAAIETKNLTRRYGEFTAVDGLTLQVPRGEVFGFLGPNGAGKSTTVKMLTTLLDPSDGSARVAGFSVAEDPLEVRRRIGYLPERMPVYERMTAREFLRTFARIHKVPRSERGDRIETLLARVKLGDVEGKPVGEFSKGMRQRLGLANALLSEPEVLFMDEPASGLDPTGQREIRTLLRDIVEEGTTIFLCTHQLAQARDVCDRVGFIREGKLTAVRVMEDVAKQGEDLDALYQRYAEGVEPEDVLAEGDAAVENATSEPTRATFERVEGDP